jgi:hypothetical protein
MDFGIGIATSSDSWKLAQRAEELGFTHAWFFDTQMITGDCFVAMAGAALKTSRIRLGTGVLVPSNRIAAVTANAFATLNGLARDASISASAPVFRRAARWGWGRSSSPKWRNTSASSTGS